MSHFVFIIKQLSLLLCVKNGICLFFFYLLANAFLNLKLNCLEDFHDDSHFYDKFDTCTAIIHVGDVASDMGPNFFSVVLVIQLVKTFFSFVLHDSFKALFG